MWSYNTHPQMFPLAQDLARFSDVVGASHSKYFSVYKYNSEASGGMKMLAEQGNTTELELEIQREVKIIIIINNNINILVSFVDIFMKKLYPF